IRQKVTCMSIQTIIFTATLAGVGSNWINYLIEESNQCRLLNFGAGFFHLRKFANQPIFQ
ncbi:MAG: hypothetical protein K8R37_06820, partial [Bacteroidales bacterium]|nr:hypothetical protein [Bacteroidales bacterium]